MFQFTCRKLPPPQDFWSIKFSRFLTFCPDSGWEILKHFMGLETILHPALANFVQSLCSPADLVFPGSGSCTVVLQELGHH